MANANPMSALFQRLADSGFDAAYVRRTALPDWWDASMGDSSDGYNETLTLLSRNLGLELNSLLDARAPVTCRDFGATRFNMKRGRAESDLMQAVSIVGRAAQLACFAMSARYCGLSASGVQVRNAILRGRDRKMDFESLMDYCWDIGIPVLRVGEFPKGVRKMDAVAARLTGRPAIALTKNTRRSAWLLFVLAHELGHIARGHLDSVAMVVDDDVDRLDDNAMEADANAFAMELLTGRDNPAQWSPEDVIAPSEADISRIHARMREGLDWERLPESSSRFLKVVTGAGR